MVQAIRFVLPDAIIGSYPNGRDIMALKNFDYVWLNWFENLPHDKKICSFIKKIAHFVLLKTFRIKIIVTLHNRTPHDSDGLIWDRLMFNMTLRVADKILILSSDSKKILKDKFGENILRRVVLVPHPTYDCQPKNRSEGKPFSVLFFGHLRPYKNIEMILELAKMHPDIKFTIAGRALDKAYENYLKDTAKLIQNVTLISHFLTSEEIDNLIEDNSILLLPYNITSSLNSGIVIHAICKKINMIVPQIGTVNQLKNKDKVFAYSYDSPESHIAEVNRMIHITKDEYENNIEKFNNRIDILYDEVMATQSPKALLPHISKLFN